MKHVNCCITLIVKFAYNCKLFGWLSLRNLQLLVSVDTTLLHLSLIDDDIYQQFRVEFPDFSVDCFDDAVIKSPEEKAVRGLSLILY